MEIVVKNIMLLIELLRRGGRYSYVSITTSELGEILGKSQQTISNNLLELEAHNYIERIKDSKGSMIRVSEKGYDELFKLSLMLKYAIDGINEIEIKGVIVRGMGEGSYYISLPGYKRQFIEKLGFEPYEGTLNIRLDRYYRSVKSVLKMQPSILIEGFSDGNRTYGWVKCYKAVIEGIEGAALILERTHHDDSILEVIAPVKIMERLNLDYGSHIIVRVKF